VLVRDMIRIEAKGTRELFAKTGWTGTLGWWVGWVEDGSRITAFALNMDMASVDMAAKRIEIARALLARLGVY
jgi:beta-lactamase class D